MSSALVKYERPGLLSKGKKRIGRFGIGFFSSFMIADEVLVTSRPFDTGRDELRTLHFRDGLGHRPLLLNNKPVDLSILTSTRVRLKLSADQRTKLLRLPSVGRLEPLSMSLAGLVGALCPMLDVDICVEQKGESCLVHKRRWMEEDRLSWLRRVAAADARADELLEKNLAASAPLLTFVNQDEPSAGLACISGYPGGGVSTVGTLRASSLYSTFSDEFTGVIDYEPEDPRRSRGIPVAGEHLKVWASNQAIRHRDAGTETLNRIYIAQRVADFGGDATPIVMMRLNQEWKDLAEIVKYLAEEGPLYAPLKYQDFNSSVIAITVVRERHTGFIDSYRPGELEYVVPTIEAAIDQTSNLYILESEGRMEENGFYEMLCRFASQKGLRISAEIIERIEFARYIGQTSLRDDLVYGKIIGCSALKIWAEHV